jgi:hypothetical protein
MSAAVADREPHLLSAEAMQYEVDRAAHFNMFAMPDERSAIQAIAGGKGSGPVIGYEIHEALHRFEIETFPPDCMHPIRARNTIGECAGVFRHRWMFMPADYHAAPDRDPPETVFTHGGYQRFAMLDSICTFGDGADGFRGFGSGNMRPSTGSRASRQLVTAIGTIVEGFGRFQGHEEGTYVYCGAFDPERGFTGSVLLRVMDRDGILQTDRALPEIDPRANPEPDVVYMLFRGQAVPSDAVSSETKGLSVDQGIRLLHLDCSIGSRRGVESTSSVGPRVGKVTAHVTFDPAAPGGGILDPIPFTSSDEFVFRDLRGEPAGSLRATSTEGRVFHTSIGGRQGLRFGGTGDLLSGTGSFQNAVGLMTDNSIVLFDPHVSASVYVLRLEDPEGRFQSR